MLDSRARPAGSARASCVADGQLRALGPTMLSTRAAHGRIELQAFAFPPLDQLLQNRQDALACFQLIAQLRRWAEGCDTTHLLCANATKRSHSTARDDSPPPSKRVVAPACRGSLEPNGWLDCRNDRSLPCAFSLAPNMKRVAYRLYDTCLLPSLSSYITPLQASPRIKLQQAYVSVHDATAGAVRTPVHVDASLERGAGFSALLELTQPTDYVGGAGQYFAQTKRGAAGERASASYRLEHRLGSVSVHGALVPHATSPLVAGRRSVLVFRFDNSSLVSRRSVHEAHAERLHTPDPSPCCQRAAPQTRLARPPALHAVATSHPLATICGEAALQRGGSAVDAAIAANLCQSVADPSNCGIGGDLFVQVWHRGKLRGYNGSGRSPAELNLTSARADGLSSRSPRSITVPGTVDGFDFLWRNFGKLPWAALFRGAIRLAEQGHVESSVMANPALAETLRRLAAGGADDFYRGALARDIVNAANALGSPLTVSDFAAHAGEEMQPVSSTYRGKYRVWELQSNSQGITALQTLNLLEMYNLSSMEFSSAPHLHLMIEATKLAYADRARFFGEAMAGNGTRQEGLVQKLVSKEYAAERSFRLRQQRRASKLRHVQKADFAGARLQPEGDTVSIVTADEQGMLVSLMQSNFNSQFNVESLGFVLHNRGTLFSLRDRSPDLYGPRRRPFHTLTPGFVSKLDAQGQEQPWLAFGATGGSTQPVAHVQLLTNLIDFNMSLQAAIDAPRFAHWHPHQPSGYWSEPHWQPTGWQLLGGSPATRMGTDGFVQLEQLDDSSCRGQTVRHALAALGHALPIRPSTSPGRIQAVQVELVNGLQPSGAPRYTSASDSRAAH